MNAALLLLAGCALLSAEDARPAGVAGAVELRVLAPACDAPAPACQDADTVEGLAGAIVWTDAGAGPPTRGSLTFTSRGPVPAAQVLPAGSTLALANARSERLAVHWEAAGRVDSAVLASQAGRVILLPEGGEVRVVADGDVARVIVGGVGGVTDSQGRVVLDDIRAGVQTLHVTHPRLGERSLEVRVPADDRVVVEVELRPEAPEALADSDAPS